MHIYVHMHIFTHYTCICRHCMYMHILKVEYYKLQYSAVRYSRVLTDAWRRVQSLVRSERVRLVRNVKLEPKWQWDEHESEAQIHTPPKLGWPPGWPSLPESKASDESSTSGDCHLSTDYDTRSECRSQHCSTYRFSTFTLIAVHAVCILT